MLRRYEDVSFYAYAHPDTSIRIVAAISQLDNGTILNWAAYIGCAPVGTVVRDGMKLLDSQAAGFFPDLPIERYRA